MRRLASEKRTEGEESAQNDKAAFFAYVQNDREEFFGLFKKYIKYGIIKK